MKKIYICIFLAQINSDVAQNGNFSSDNLFFIFYFSLKTTFKKTFLCSVLTVDPLHVHTDFQFQKEKLTQF